MSVFDEFYSNTHIFEGEVPEKLNIHNLDRMTAEHGKEWVMGYLKAIEVVAVDVADILSPRDDNPGGIIQTPHMVRTNLKEYWNHNKILYRSLVSRLDSSDSQKSKPEPK